MDMEKPPVETASSVEKMEKPLVETPGHEPEWKMLTAHYLARTQKVVINIVAAPAIVLPIAFGLVWSKAIKPTGLPLGWVLREAHMLLIAALGAAIYCRSLAAATGLTCLLLGMMQHPDAGLVSVGGPVHVLTPGHVSYAAAAFERLLAPRLRDPVFSFIAREFFYRSLWLALTVAAVARFPRTDGLGAQLLHWMLFLVTGPGSATSQQDNYVHFSAHAVDGLFSKPQSTLDVVLINVVRAARPLPALGDGGGGSGGDGGGGSGGGGGDGLGGAKSRRRDDLTRARTWRPRLCGRSASRWTTSSCPSRTCTRCTTRGFTCTTTTRRTAARTTSPGPRAWTSADSLASTRAYGRTCEMPSHPRSLSLPSRGGGGGASWYPPFRVFTACSSMVSC